MSIRLYRSVLVVITCLLCSTGFAGEQPYRFGLGKADITNEAAEVGMMGYSSTDQKTGGIHTRQWSRAFIIEDAATGKRLVYVNTDLGMIFQAVQQKCVAQVGEEIPWDL